MSLQPSFRTFQKKINPERFSENATLVEKRDAVLKRLRTERTFTSFNQGRSEMGTGVKPTTGDYDIDVGVVFELGQHDESFDGTPAADEVPLARWVGTFAPRACRYLRERFFRRLVGGERSFPKEDQGSMRGFERILEYRRTDVDPDDEGDLGAWLGDWQPEVDIQRVRAQFDSERKPRARR